MFCARAGTSGVRLVSFHFSFPRLRRAITKGPLSWLQFFSAFAIFRELDFHSKGFCLKFEVETHRAPRNRLVLRAGGGRRPL